MYKTFLRKIETLAIRPRPLLNLRQLDNNIVSVTEAPGVTIFQWIDCLICIQLATGSALKENYVSLGQLLAWLYEVTTIYPMVNKKKKKLFKENSFPDSFE